MWIRQIYETSNDLWKSSMLTIALDSTADRNWTWDIWHRKPSFWNNNSAILAHCNIDDVDDSENDDDDDDEESGDMDNAIHFDCFVIENCELIGIGLRPQ